MRIRTLATAGSAAALLVGMMAAPASATYAGWCQDQFGYIQEAVDWPVTVGIEVSFPVTSTGHQTLIVCYSTSPNAADGAIVSGNIDVDVQTDTGLATPGAHVGILCQPDAGTALGTACNLQDGATLQPGALIPNAQLTQQNCLVVVNGSCAAYAPGIRLSTAGGNAAVLTLIGQSFPAYVPPICVGVAVGVPVTIGC